MTDTLRLLTLRGAAVEPWLDAAARLRIRVFREFPYLYDGDVAYERSYLQHYVDCPDSVMVLALNGEEAIGASTGLPLAAADAAFAEPFVAAGIDVDRVFYFGESVLDAQWRGQGLGHRFMDAREAHAASLGCPITAFCAVDRPDDHPLKPTDYRSLHPFWRARGYVQRPELVVRFPWKQVDSAEEVMNSLTFWLRGDSTVG